MPLQRFPQPQVTELSRLTPCEVKIFKRHYASQLVLYRHIKVDAHGA